MTPPYDSHRDPTIRASDADREAVAEVLRKHHTEGRLDSEEMQQRIDACYEAKTFGDLEGLLDDLPRAPDRERESRGRGFPFRCRRALFFVVPALIAFGVVGLIHAITGDGGDHDGLHFLWLALPLSFIAFRFLVPWRRRRHARRGNDWA